MHSIRCALLTCPTLGDNLLGSAVRMCTWKAQHVCGVCRPSPAHQQSLRFRSPNMRVWDPGLPQGNWFACSAPMREHFKYTFPTVSAAAYP